MGDSPGFVIIGAGQSGAWVARTLRTEGYTGRIVLIGDEGHWPYERPPLSKAVLRNEEAAATSSLLSEEVAVKHGIEGWLNDPALSIDRERRTVTCASGRTVSYDTLFLTTGGRARTLSFADPSRSPLIHVLRTRDDAIRLRDAMARARRLAVLGGGWIGLEVAATARSLGLEVTVLEAGQRLCGRGLPPVVSDYLHDLHVTNGVTIRLGCSVQGMEVDTHSVHIQAAGDTILSADMVVLGIGMVPQTGLAQECGVVVDDGVIVDHVGRTSDKRIFAVGDVARHPNTLLGRTIRLESWANAQNQAIVAAKAALGQAVRYDEVPWLWSDQYGVSLQILGFPHLANVAVARGDPKGGAGCWLFHGADNLAVGAVAINAPREMALLRRLMNGGKAPGFAVWTDTTLPLNRLPTVPLKPDNGVT